MPVTDERTGTQGGERALPFSDGELVLWIIMVAVTMLFVSVTSAYLFGAWFYRPLVDRMTWPLMVNTVVLVASSAAVELAGRRLQQHRQQARVILTAGVLLGIVFLVGQWLVWQQLAAEAAWRTVMHTSFFYVFSGLHGLHILVGLVVLGSVAFELWRDLNSLAVIRRLRLGSSFWHFLLALWLGIVVLLFWV